MRRIALELFHIKNVYLFLGVLFGFFSPLEEWYIVPAIVLIILSGLQYYQVSVKKKESLEIYLDGKLKKYEEDLRVLKEENEKIKQDINGFKNRESFLRMYGNQTK